MLPDRSDLPELYGALLPGSGGALFWPDEVHHMTFVPVPAELQPYLLYSGKPVTKVYCNKEMALALSQAFGNILDRGLKSEVKEWGGCFMLRNTRGADTPSVHCWGLAVDINPSTNQLGTQGDISPELVKCFTDAGFVWGGTFHRLDPMHFQYCIEN